MHAKDAGEETCGRELARDAEVRELLARLMEHVAANMESHALWVRGSEGMDTAEERGLREVAENYRWLAKAAERAAATMRAMRDAPPVAHAPELLDGEALASWMKTKVQLQRRLAELLSRHADESEAVLGKMSRTGAK